MSTFADRVITFNENLKLNCQLPRGVRAMNPFQNPQALKNSSRFYQKFYSDNHCRKLIIGINPGRLGAGVTGVPFTDTKRLKEVCGIAFEGLHTHEPSSIFIYQLIAAYGGVEKFYRDVYINSICPLGLVRQTQTGKEINFNYYDDNSIYELLKDFMVTSMQKQITFGVDTDVAYCLGSHKNYQYINRLNNRFHFFDRLIPLEHPRYIVQYRSKRTDFYIDKYLQALNTGS